jgi:hypothetical protein
VALACLECDPWGVTQTVCQSLTGRFEHNPILAAA